MRYRYFYLFLFIITNISHGNEQGLEFTQLPGLIKNRNAHYESAKLKLEAAETRKGFLTRSFLPHVEAFGGAEDFQKGLSPERQDPFYGATFEMNVYRGGRDGLHEESLGAQVSSAKAEADENYLDKLLKARVAFWEYAAAMEQKSIVQEGINYNEKNLLSAKKRIGAGLGTNTDQLEFEIKGQQLVQDLNRLTSTARGAELNLKVLLALDSTVPIVVRDRIPMPEVQNFNESFDVTTFPTLAKELNETKKVKLEKSLASRWWLPQLNVYGGYAMKTMRDSDQSRKQDRDETFAGVKLSINFDALQDYNESKAMASEALAAQKRYEQSYREAETLYQSSLRELRQNQDLILGADSIRQKAKRYFVQTLGEYKRGIKNSADVSAATDKFVDAETRFVELKKNYQLADAQLLSLLGRNAKENEM